MNIPSKSSSSDLANMYECSTLSLFSFLKLLELKGSVQVYYNYLQLYCRRVHEIVAPVITSIFWKNALHWWLKPGQTVLNDAVEDVFPSVCSSRKIASQFETKNNMEKILWNDRCHKNQESYFSSSSGFSNFRGFLNLALVFLFIGNIRLIFENSEKYGVLGSSLFGVNFSLVLPIMCNLPKLLLVAVLLVLFTFQIQRYIIKRQLSETTAMVINVVILCFTVVWPAYMVHIHRDKNYDSTTYLILSCITLTGYTILFLKLWSYIHVNYLYRKTESETKDNTEKYLHSQRRRSSSLLSVFFYSATEPLITTRETLPHEDGMILNPISKNNNTDYLQSICLRNLLYFIIAPTLCYELQYPKTTHFRKLFFFKRLLEVIFLTQIMVFLTQQWMLPLLKNSVLPLQQLDWFHIIERIMKLAIPNIIIWLMAFYTVFHSLLNIIAEVTYFADRDFYRDWWNASSTAKFWSTWNLPTHKWARRHVYKPLRNRGYSQIQAALLVFFLSAIFHEYLISFPLGILRLWAFFAMILQVPFFFLMKHVKNETVGNTSVWLFLLLGQPLAITMYFYDFHTMYNLVNNIYN